MAKPAPQPAVLPKPDDRVEPTADEFESWTLHPVTKFVAAAWQAAAHAQRVAWTADSWSSGEANPMTLLELRTRADAYSAFLETGLERYVELNTQDQ